MAKKLNWKRIHEAGQFIGKKGSKLAYDIAVGEGRRQKATGDRYKADFYKSYRTTKRKSHQTKVVYVYPSGKKKIKIIKKKSKPAPRRDPFNPFGLDF